MPIRDRKNDRYYLKFFDHDDNKIVDFPNRINLIGKSHQQFYTDHVIAEMLKEWGLKAKWSNNKDDILNSVMSKFDKVSNSSKQPFKEELRKRRKII